MEMKKVLKVILVRSGILLSLLVVLIVAIKTMVHQEPAEEPQKGRYLAILAREQIQERGPLIKGLKDGLVFNGLNYEVKIYTHPSQIYGATLAYCADSCFAEEILKQNLQEQAYTIIGYSYREESQERYTGIYCGLSWEAILPLYQSVLHGKKRWGIVYSEGSCDGEKQAMDLKSALEKKNMVGLIQTLTGNGENIEKTISELFHQVDVIYLVARDEIIQAHLDSIIKLCSMNRIPVIGGGIFGAQKGAVMSIDYDPYLVGRKSAELLKAFDQGNSPAAIPILRLEPDILINLESAFSLGITIPLDVRNKAKKIF
jgi:hypothetical protein